MTLHEFLSGLTWGDIGTLCLIAFPARVIMLTLFQYTDRRAKK